jgi:hypothetical protein
MLETINHHLKTYLMGIRLGGALLFHDFFRSGFRSETLLSSLNTLFVLGQWWNLKGMDWLL